jgi:annexin A7/11
LLQVLEEHGILQQMKRFAGTSAGAITAALLAVGYNSYDAEKILGVDFPILIAKYLFTGSLKNRLIDNLETQKKYISMTNSPFFNYLLYAKSK